MKRWLKPLVPQTLLSIFKKSDSRYFGFRGEYATWEQARLASLGYDAASVLEKVKAATLKVARGEAAYERDSVLFEKLDTSWTVLSGLLWAAARDGGRLAVLDFGGSLGTTYLQNKVFLDSLPDVKWGIVEQSHYVAVGRDNFESERLRFFETIQECVTDIRPNVIVLGAAIQYVANPFGILAELAESPANVMIIDRTPFSSEARDIISVQHVEPSIYKAAYPSWIFSGQQFDLRVGANWTVAQRFDCPEGSIETDTGQRMTFRGIILSR